MDGPKPVATLQVNQERLEAQTRVVVYTLVNTLAMTFSNMGRAYGLKPSEVQILLLIGLAGVQRLMRQRPVPADVAGIEAVPAEQLSGISRRKLAELTGLSREAVRRIADRLMEKGLVLERGRGMLAQTPGVLAHLSKLYSYREMLAPFLTMFEQLERLGVVERVDWSAASDSN